MAVQSLEDEVLRAIKRDNISTDTYVEYQKKFHRMGSQTYSDLIVPLPMEALTQHLESIRKLMIIGVDKIVCHNMRLLARAGTAMIVSEFFLRPPVACGRIAAPDHKQAFPAHP